jgi:hypothetical protein
MFDLQHKPLLCGVGHGLHRLCGRNLPGVDGPIELLQLWCRHILGGRRERMLELCGGDLPNGHRRDRLHGLRIGNLFDNDRGPGLFRVHWVCRRQVLGDDGRDGVQL